MNLSKQLLAASAVLVAGFTASAHAGLASCNMTILPDTGDAYVEGLPATKTVNLLGETTTVLADGDGRARKVIDGAGKASTMAYDANGNLLSRRDATGAGADYAYDELNRRTSETDAQIAGKTRSYTYDLADRLLTATDPLGIVTTYGYDLRDRKVSESTPMNGSVNRLIQYGYDGRGHMTSLTDANGAVTTWGFDSAGRQISKTYANGDHRAMQYDGAGRLAVLTDENGHDITSTYDIAGRLVSKAYAADSTTDTLVYDHASRIISATKGRFAHTETYAYDTAGRLASETHPDGEVIHYAYDLANRLANLSLGSGTGVPPVYSVDYARDARGLLSTVTSGDYATAYQYRDNGQLASTLDSRIGVPTGDILRADRTYDAGARLLGVANTAANGDQAGVVYTLGADDQRLTATEETGQKWDYGYDGLKQLVTAKKTDTSAVTVPPLDQNYTFDPMGNRSAYTEQGTSVAYTKNNANQYTSVVASGLVPRTSNPVYDANGNMLTDGVKNYVWDAENQLVSVTPVAPLSGDLRADFTYDWRMRRISKTTYVYSSGSWAVQKTTRYKYREWTPIEETVADATGTITEVKRYVWGNDLSGSLDGAGGVGGLLSMSHLTPATSTPDTYFYAFDGNGNVRALVKADATNPSLSAMVEKYAYDGFGREIIAPPSISRLNSFAFSTKYWDVETSMNYYGYRYYAAGDGRWINRDPILEKGGRNVYAMVGNELTGTFDMLGMWKVTRDSSKTIAEAVAEEGDGWAGLADMVKLNLSEYPSWVTDVTMNPIPCKKYGIPNTIIRHWGGVWGALGRTAVGWPYDAGSGYHYQDMTGSDRYQLRDALAPGLGDKLIYGFAFYGHGNANGLTAVESRFWIDAWLNPFPPVIPLIGHGTNVVLDYVDMENVLSMTYHMGYVNVHACETSPAAKFMTSDAGSFTGTTGWHIPIIND